MTDEEKDERREQARIERQKAAKKAEKRFQRCILSTVTDPDDVQKLSYIHKEIMSGRREESDLLHLRATRRAILRPYDLQEAAA